MLRIGVLESIIGCLNSSRDSETLRSSLNLMSRIVSLVDNDYLIQEILTPVVRCLALPDIRIKQYSLKIVSIFASDGKMFY